MQQVSWSLTIWGCRGSVAVDREGTRRHGGSTTCLELDTPEARIIIDGGTGLPELNRIRGNDRKPTLVLISHLHWDHISGVPYFTPMFVPGWEIALRGVRRDGLSVLDGIMRVNRPPTFPVSLLDVIQADFSHGDIPMAGSMTFGRVGLEWMEVAHPGGCSAFAMEVGGKRLVFTGDMELPSMDQAALRRFCKGADLLIVDAQYTPDEYAKFRGWGHSTNVQAAEFAQSAGVGQLLLTHHDPTHDDDAIDAMVAQAKVVFEPTEAARAGMVAAEG